MADLDRDTARALAGICRDCPEPALDGGLGAKCLAVAAAGRKRQRQERADAGVCIEAGCGARIEKALRHDGSAVLRRCKACARRKHKGRRDIRRGVTGTHAGVTGNGADPAFARVARTKVERAYDKLASGSERFIERTVFRTRGGQSRESMDADEDQMLQWVAEGVEGHARRRQRLRDEEPALGRQQRKEAGAIVGERIFSAAKCLLEIAARYNRESFALMAEWTRLMIDGEDDDDER